MKIHKIKKQDLKYITPSFFKKTKDEILKKIMCVGETRLNGGGFHPTRSMSYMMRLTNDDIINAIHHINEAYKIEQNNYILYPYTFDFLIHGNTDNIIKSNWFSGMGQGFALMAYVRSGKREIADKILNSFESGVFTEETPDGNHYMEYPNHCDALNGHIFALYGLYEYWYNYQTKQSEKLLIEGIRWVKNNLHKYRNVKGASFYCTNHKVLCDKLDGKYHKVHIEQLEYLGLITNDDWFNKQADLFKQDFFVNGIATVLSNETI